MTNAEKFKEIFGDTGADVKAKSSWLNAEYNGPVHKTEHRKFLDWLDTVLLAKYEVKNVDSDSPLGSTTTIYVRDFKGNPIIRVSNFTKTPEGPSAYVRYEGLCGYMPVSKIKEIINKAVDKSNPFEELFKNDGPFDLFAH